MRRSHHGFARISSSHEIEVFQSSCDVVIVEDHRSSARLTAAIGSSPRPTLPVEARVLLEVGNVVAGLAVGAATLADKGAGLGSVLIGIDLITQHQKQMRPALGGCSRSRVASA